MKELGIYIHMPFCKKKCDYCDFTSYTRKEELIEKYIKSLNKEIIQKIQANSEILKYNASTVYIGGGTPSYVESKYIREIINTLKNIGILKNEKPVEITIEANPGTLTEEKLNYYYNLGINRLSMGLQSTNNNLLQTIGRIHTYEEFVENFKLARKIGFKNINVDLMIGLPNQKEEQVEDSLNKIIKLNPEHISVYSLIVEEGTKIEKRLKQGEITLPKESVERKMYWTVKQILEKAGYIHYEISNFAKPSYKSKHNLNCWEQKEYLGFGVAAHSYFNNIRYSNTENIEKYIAGSKPIIHEIQTEETGMKEYMLLGLRKIEGIRISEFKNKYVENPIFIFRKELDKLVKQNLIEIDIDSIHLSKKGIDLANLVWEEFV